MSPRKPKSAAPRRPRSTARPRQAQAAQPDLLTPQVRAAPAKADAAQARTSPAATEQRPQPADAAMSDRRADRRWRERIGQYWLLIRGHRPIGILLLLWPTWWALWLAADGFPTWRNWAIFTAGVWLTRSAGCVINDYADRWLDPQVERTKTRPLATGAVSGREALIVFAVLMLIAFGLVLMTNRLTVELSFVGVLLATSYPYLKRHTYLPQVYLGLAFGWGIPMAFAATQDTVPVLAWLLFLANVVWATAYDTWYAMVDRDDDLRAGAKSTAILFGDADLIAQGILYALFLATLILLGLQAKLALAYYAGVAIAASMIVWEFRIARRRDREGCFRAFLHNNWVGATVFAGIVLGVAMR
jgi:4-hydroxybenzoate polyprenyltransferase